MDRYWSQFCGFCSIKLVIILPNVLLNLSTIPLEQGRYGVVLVFLICKSRHTSLNRMDSKLRPWSVCSSRGQPNVAINLCTKAFATVCSLVWNGICLHPSGKIITYHQYTSISLGSERQGPKNIYTNAIQRIPCQVLAKASTIRFHLFPVLTAYRTLANMLSDINPEVIPVEPLPDFSYSFCNS